MRAQTSRIFVVGLMAALAVWNAADAADQVAWAPDLPNAQKLASERNQLVLLHFWSPDCAPCQQLEHTVFKDSEFGHVVSRDYVPVKINVKQSPSLAYQYGVNRWPMDVITTSDGRLIHKMDSPSESQQYTFVLNQISARRRVYGDADVTTSRPAEGGLAAYNQLGNVGPGQSRPTYDQLGYDRERPSSGFADNSAPRNSGGYQYDARSDASYSGLPAQQQTQPRQAPPMGDVYNPYTSRNSGSPPPARRDLGVSPDSARAATPEPWNRSQPPTASGLVTNDYASRQLEPSTQYGNGGRSLSAAPNRDQPSYRPSARQELGAYTATQPPIGQTPSRPASSQRPPLGTDNRFGPNSGHAVNNDAVPPIESFGAQSPGRGAGADSAGSQSQTSPSWGLEGYCPVVLVEQSKWVKGDPRWGVVHRSRTYLFSSVDAKQRFWSQPDRYAPALSGIDPVLFTGSGQHVDGKRNHGVVYRDQVYLFANEQTLQRFWRSPEDFAEQVRQATRASEDQQRRR